MKAKISIRTSSRLLPGVISVLLASTLSGQTLINLGSQGRNADFTNFPYTRPIKTGTAIPPACSVGDVFFNTAAAAGQNIFTCTATNIWTQQGGLQDPGNTGLVKRTSSPNATTVVAAPYSAIVGADDVQTLTNKSIDASEINSGTLSSSRLPVLTGDVTTAANSSLTTLSTVNPSPGTYGDGSHALQLTVDSKGRVTGVNSIAMAQSSVNSSPGTFGSATQIPVITVNSAGQVTAVTTATATGGGLSATAGTLSNIPSACSTGSLYLASDQPIGQQLYTCSSSNNWTLLVSLGSSGALAISSGSLDIVTSVVPRLMAANTFTGLNTFAGLKLSSGSAQPSCDSTSRGSVWFQNNGAAKDSLQVCVYSGSAYAWTNLY